MIIPTIIQASESNLQDAFYLMKAFHASVAQYPGEIESPSMERFLSYWHPSKTRIVFVLYDKSRPIGVSLLQELDSPKRMEFGAIYILPEYRRGNNAYLLYRACINTSKARHLPIVSEISVHNSHSVRVAKALLTRHMKHNPDAKSEILPITSERIIITLTHE